MSRDLSEVLVQDSRTLEFSRAEEEMILPISIENSVIFRFNDKINNFEFDEEKTKAFDMACESAPITEFEIDFERLKNNCNDANPSSYQKALISTLAFSEVLFVCIAFLIIWVILILDLVILAAELYLLKKIKRFVWS